jgi:uncharacterized OB-fold protein
VTGHPLVAERSPSDEPYWRALEEGHLIFQRCQACGLALLPARENCPSCLGTALGWHTASGSGQLVSWVVYHRCYHPAFADMIPYNVAIVELAEGPRLISSILAPSPEQQVDYAQLGMGTAVRLRIRERFGVSLPFFVLADG